MLKKHLLIVTIAVRALWILAYCTRMHSYPIVCNDSSACTNDSSTRCTYTPISCDDNDACPVNGFITNVRMASATLYWDALVLPSVVLTIILMLETRVNVTLLLYLKIRFRTLFLSQNYCTFIIKIVLTFTTTQTSSYSNKIRWYKCKVANSIMSEGKTVHVGRNSPLANHSNEDLWTSKIKFRALPRRWCRM